jgi:hypothetical protein
MNNASRVVAAQARRAQLLPPRPRVCASCSSARALRLQKLEQMLFEVGEPDQWPALPFEVRAPHDTSQRPMRLASELAWGMNDFRCMRRLGL